MKTGKNTCVSGYNGDMKNAEKNSYRTLTIIFAIAYFIFKTWTLGWITLIFGLIFLALGIIYFMYGFKFAGKAKKVDIDYALYWIISISLVLFAFFFVDGGDVSLDVYSSQVIKAIPHTVSAALSFAFGCIMFISLVTAGIIGIVRKTRSKKQL